LDNLISLKFVHQLIKFNYLNIGKNWMINQDTVEEKFKKLLVGENKKCFECG